MCLKRGSLSAHACTQVPRAQVVLLEDFRYTGDDKHDLATRQVMLNWLEGFSIEIRMPKGEEDAEDISYVGDAPIFMTGPTQLMIFDKGRFNKSDTEMYDARINYFHYLHELRKPNYELSKIKCPCCWSRMVLGYTTTSKIPQHHRLNFFQAAAKRRLLAIFGPTQA